MSINVDSSSKWGSIDPTEPPLDLSLHSMLTKVNYAPKTKALRLNIKTTVIADPTKSLFIISEARV